MSQENKIKFDIHTHVGDIPQSQKQKSLKRIVTPQQCADFLHENEITHTCVLYSHYDAIHELDKLCPDVKLYGVKWINDPYNDELDEGKPLYYGIKLHSHRSRYTCSKTGEQINGVDYTKSNIMGAILDRVANNRIVYMHTQESVSPLNKSCPKSVLKNAIKYTNLKFIIGHSGHYGSFAVARPNDRHIDTSYVNWEKQNNGHLGALSQYVLSVADVHESVLMTKYTHNIFLDSSIWTPQKAQALNDCDKWCIGTDWPFGGAVNHKFDTQHRRFLKVMTEEHIENAYKQAIKYFETDVQQLADELYENSNKKNPPRKRRGYSIGNPITSISAE